MDFKVIIMAAACVVLAAFHGCDNTASSAVSDGADTPAAVTPADDADKEDETEAPPVLTAKGINGIESGASIEALVGKGALVKGVLENGEGTFEIWDIMDETHGKIGYVMEHPMEKGKVGGISITSDKVETGDGLRVGSTWANIVGKFPDTQVYGSEIEGRTSAVVGRYSYQLDERHWQYELDESKIPPTAKVEEIGLSHHTEE